MPSQRDPTRSPADTAGGVDNSDRRSTPAEQVAGRRVIPVGDARTIVVHPRIPTIFKALLILSLVLNAIVLLLMLTFGLEAYRTYRAWSGELRALADRSGMAASIPAQGRDAADAARYAAEAAGRGSREALAAVEEIQNATIKGTVAVDQQLPLQFQAPVQQDTTLVTNAAVQIGGPARITLAGGAGYLNATVSMALPAGSEIPVRLGLNVPISTTVPAKFDVPLSIPVRETELARPFDRLRRLLEPVVQFFGSRE